MNVITINGWCKKCGICATYCPKKVYDSHDGKIPVIARPEDCVGCLLCEQQCPDFAVSVEADKNEQ